MQRKIEEFDRMKERLTISLSMDLKEAIEREQKKLRIDNTSKFVEYVLREILFTPEKRLKLMERRRDKMAKEFKQFNDEYLDFQEVVEQKIKAREAEEKYNANR
jgi:hypothetical protein